MKIYTFKNINDASTKIKSQNINIISTGGYTFNTGTPISAVYIGVDNFNNTYAIIVNLNIVMIRSFASFGSSYTGPARVYYI